MLTERDYQLLKMDTISSYFPIEFSNGAVWEELDGECQSCKKTLPRNKVRGLVSRPFSNVAVVEAVGVCDDCKMLTRYQFRLHDDMSVTGLSGTKWRTWKAKPSFINRMLNLILGFRQ